ncbi:AAA family ATPase [Archangium sp.]|uniref:AAA family ATPase n=1 Tax=Archangium sp. TaxID=1872627 RepID=UPI002D596FA0|nr:AAA family ATPase [Archangium sp.]HYO55710.1 AAA family ATPase [Archangium sp.]
MAKLRWLQVNKFRTVKPGTRLTFNPGYNVLLGQNGTGKTTLLNLVSAVVRSDFHEFEEIEFDLEYELESTDAGTVTFAVRQQRSAEPLLSELEPLPPEVLTASTLAEESGLRRPVFSACLRFTPAPSGAPISLTIKGSSMTVQAADERPGGPPSPFDVPEGRTLRGLIGFGLLQGIRSRQQPPLPPSSPALLRLVWEESTSRFDESLEHFNSLRNLSCEARRAADASLSGPPTLAEFYPPLLEQLEQRWGADRYILGDEQIPFLKEAVRYLDFQSAEAIFELLEASGADSMKLGNLKFLFTHRGGWRIAEKQLSYGQKRMLAFLHYLTTVRSVAIADELVNGLHHRWIRASIEALGERQVFLTSQNPLLLDYLTFESPEEVHRTFVLCRWEQGSEQMVWENMSQEAAEDFFDSYKVGFQQVGELLQTKGLW